MLQLVALNKPKQRQVAIILGNLRACSDTLFWKEIADEVPYCNTLEELQALPQPAGDYGFVIGRSRGITPEQLGDWLATSGLTVYSEGFVVLYFVGKVVNSKDYQQVVHAYFTAASID